jgi:hypothetical protein
MLKHLAIVAIVSASIVYCAGANAGESMSMSEGNFAVASNSPASELDTTVAPARDDADAVGAMRKTGSMHGNDAAAEVTMRRRLHPDSAPATTAARTDRTHTAIGTDAAAADAPVRKNHNGASWQSLLPGVMK